VEVVGALLAVIINKMNKKILIWILIVIVIGGFFVFKGGITGGVIGASDKTIKISLSEISENANFYEFEGIRYFIVKSKERDVKTAFDACDVCYGSKKGYRQEGENMICNNCGNKYSISGLGTENLKGGGCWPGYLPSKIEGDYIVIKKSDLEKGRYRF